MSWINKISGYVLFISCMTLPFSYQISTILIMVFSGLTVIGNYKSIDFQKKFDVWDKLQLPWLLFLFPAIGIFLTSHKIGAMEQIVKYLPYLILSLAFSITNIKYHKTLREHAIRGLIWGVTLVLIYLFSTIIINFSNSD